MFEEKNPEVLGRMDDDYEPNPRFETRQVVQVEQSFDASVVEGRARVSVYKSLDDEDRGGYVLRLEADTYNSAYLPHAVIVEKGVEIHLAGDEEADTFLRLLKKALISLKLEERREDDE